MVWSTIFVKCCRSNRNSGGVSPRRNFRTACGRAAGTKTKNRLEFEAANALLQTSVRFTLPPVQNWSVRFFFSSYRVRVCLLYFISSLKTKTKCSFSEFSVFRKCVWHSVPTDSSGVFAFWISFVHTSKRYVFKKLSFFLRNNWSYCVSYWTIYSDIPHLIYICKTYLRQNNFI